MHPFLCIEILASEAGIDMNHEGDATIIPPSKFNNIIFEICLNTVGKVTGIFSKEFENGVATNDGLGAVGQKTTSCTTHVFWVKNDPTLISAWETALE